MRRRALSATLATAVVILGAAWWLSKRPEPSVTRPPFHPVLLPREDESVRRLLADVDRLRQIRSIRPVPMGGAGDREYADVLDRIRDGSARALFYLEQIALRRAENISLRVDLLNVVARERDEATRRFLASFVADSTEDPALWIAALEPLMTYRDEATFEVLKAAWLDPAPLPGRYHLCRAFGENGRPGAMPLLRGALAVEHPAALRAHAALGLGGFAGDAGVRADLKGLARSDADPAVRANAIRSLCRSQDPEVDGFLRDLADTGDPDTRRVAQAALRQRARNP